MNFEDIVACKTRNYLILWDYKIQRYVIMPQSDVVFHAETLPECNSFSELNEAVYKECGEFIISTSFVYKYTITI